MSDDKKTPEENTDAPVDNAGQFNEVDGFDDFGDDTPSKPKAESAAPVEDVAETSVETEQEVVAETPELSNDGGEETQEVDALTDEEAATETAEEGEEETEEGEEAEEEVVKPIKVKEELYKWYSLRVISGKERKIKERIELEIQRSGWKDYINQILVPTEKVYKFRNGKKVISERNILPGYILVAANPAKFSGEMIQAIANIPNVIHFLGRNNPKPMQQSEANRMLGIVDDSQEMGEVNIEPFIIGETVKIVDGPFSEFVGDIQEVNEEKKKLKVIVKIFGRGTEVELNFMQVEKQA